MYMRGFYLKLPCLFLLLISLCLLPAGSAQAFIDIVTGSVNTRLYHTYDGLTCDDCHTIHNSRNGAPVAGGGPYKSLLTQPTATDVCLQCHLWPASSAFKAPAVMTFTGINPGTIAFPAGDFYWSQQNPAMGHNPGKTLGVQSAFMPSDSVLNQSPGGIFTTDDWDCTTCHDPHNRFGADVAAWRQLRRKVNGVVHTGDDTVAFGVETFGGDQGPTAAGFEPILSNSRGDIVGTDYNNTRADGNPIEGADLFRVEADTNKNVYRGGFSSFCAACHGDFHGGNGEAENVANANTNVDGDGRWMRHPTNIVMADKTTTGLASRKYGTGSYTAVVTNSQSTSPNPDGYDWRYPLVQSAADFTLRFNISGVGITDATLDTSRLSCLSCHKAHATQYENMTRWDTTSHAFIQDGVADLNGLPSDGDNPAYGCGKCHQKGGTNAFVKTF